MTFEEFEEEYLKDRPVEPYCEDERSDLWAQIVAYAESNLRLAYEAGRDEAYHIIQSQCPNLTCCADCHIDDFCHYEGCEILKEAEIVVKGIEQKEANAPLENRTPAIVAEYSQAEWNIFQELKDRTGLASYFIKEQSVWAQRILANLHAGDVCLVISSEIAEYFQSYGYEVFNMGDNFKIKPKIGA